MRKQWIVLFIAAGLVIFAFLQPNGSNEESAPKVGFQAPDFQLNGIDEKSYSLTKLNGKPVLINFWASWCGPCQDEATDLVHLYAKYKDKIEFYAVNSTSDDTLEGALSFSKKFKLPFPVLLDRQGSISKLYKIQSYPTTYFVNGNGTISKVNLGIVSPESLEQAIIQTIGDSKGGA